MDYLCETPKSFGPYEVLAVIGQGSTATVYQARHQRTGEVVAVKAGISFMSLEAGALERFQREFTAVSDLRHPNLVAARALLKENDTPYLVMEFVPGQNLEQRLKDCGTFSVEQTLALFVQVAEGLRYLHSRRLLHRDIKPSNIFLDGETSAKLGDFGLLKNLANEDHLTRVRQGLGTMDYGAPEQFEDAKNVDCRCDLYSLAATLFTALTAKFPFGNGGRMQIMQRKLLKQYVPLRLLMPSLDPAIDQLVDRCLDPIPDARPSHCDDFLAVLRGSKTGLAAGSVEDELFKSANRKSVQGRDRRASVRFEVDLTTTFVPFHQNMRGRWQAVILDVSSTGVRLQTSRPVAVNSVLQVTLNDRAVSQLALVRWITAGVGDELIVGCSFVRPLSEQEIDAICQVRVE